MKLCSDCSGPCEVCICTGGCVAGHGDDYFQVASEEELTRRLSVGTWSTGKLFADKEKATIQGYLSLCYNERGIS